MANVATNVSTGKPKVGGSIYVAPLGTTLPTDATSTVDTTKFTPLGYVSDDGVTNNNAPETDSVKAWGGDTVLMLQTDRPDTFAFTLIESLNKDVLETVYGGGNVTVDASDNITVKATAEELPGYCWIIDMIVRGGRAKRITIPNGTISDLGEIAYKDDDAIGYALTITDVPDSNGVYHYEYITAEAEVSG